MMPLDLTSQAAPLFWGMLTILVASAVAIVVLGVSGALSARRDLSSRLLRLQPRAKAPTDSLRSAA